jgi:ribosomal protein S18 acetylase RimI-like enzyme
LHAVIEPNKKGVYLGARMPRYHRFAQRMTPEDFIGLNGGKNQDPEIRLYLSAGFRVIRVIPGYMEDPDSCNNGVLMFWENPDYQP